MLGKVRTARLDPPCPPEALAPRANKAPPPVPGLEIVVINDETAIRTLEDAQSRRQTLGLFGDGNDRICWGVAFAILAGYKRHAFALVERCQYRGRSRRPRRGFPLRDAKVESIGRGTRCVSRSEIKIDFLPMKNASRSPHDRKKIPSAFRSEERRERRAGSLLR